MEVGKIQTKVKGPVQAFQDCLSPREWFVPRGLLFLVAVVPCLDGVSSNCQRARRVCMRKGVKDQELEDASKQSEIFPIPINDQFIVYAPQKRLAFIGHQTLLGLIHDLGERRNYGPTLCHMPIVPNRVLRPLLEMFVLLDDNPSQQISLKIEMRLVGLYHDKEECAMKRITGSVQSFVAMLPNYLIPLNSRDFPWRR